MVKLRLRTPNGRGWPGPRPGAGQRGGSIGRDADEAQNPMTSGYLIPVSEVRESA